MRLLRRLLHAPDSPAGAGADPIKGIFGGIEDSAMPELAALNEERPAKLPGMKTGPEADAAAPPKAKNGEEKAPERAARTAAPADPGKEKSDATHESADEDVDEGEAPVDEENEALGRLLSKYGSDPKNLASAIRGMQRLQNRTADQNKELETKLERALAFIDANADEGPDGELVLSPSKAGRALQARGESERVVPDRDVSLQAVERAIEAQYREKFKSMVREEDLDEFIGGMKPEIKAAAQDRFYALKMHRESEQQREYHETVGIIGRHMDANPEDKKLWPEIDQLYGTLPPEVQCRAIKEGWFGGIAKVADMTRRSKTLEAAVKEAFADGRKFERTKLKAADATPPSGGARTTTRRGREGPQNSDAAYAKDLKSRVLKAGNQPGIGSLRPSS